MITGDGNFDHLIKVVSARFLQDKHYFPFHSLFFGSKSLSLAHNQKRIESLLPLWWGEVHVIHHLEFLKDVPGSPAWMAEPSLYDVVTQVTQAFLVSGFPSIKWEASWAASVVCPAWKSSAQTVIWTVSFAIRKMSFQLQHMLPGWPWTSFLAALTSNCLVYKIEWWWHWDCTHKVFSTKLVIGAYDKFQLTFWPNRSSEVG